MLNLFQHPNQRVNLLGKILKQIQDDAFYLHIKPSFYLIIQPGHFTVTLVQ